MSQKSRDLAFDAAARAVRGNKKVGGPTVSEVFRLAFDTIKGNANFTAKDGRSVESLEHQLVRSDAVDTASVFDAAKFAMDLQALGIPSNRIPSLSQECYDILDGKSRNVQDVVASAGQGANTALGDVLGAGGLRGLAEAATGLDGMSQEAWGVDINRLESDERTNFSLAIMRTATSIEDKLFGRIPVTENTITLRYANPSVYDFAASNKSFETIRTADPVQHSYIDLQSDPRPVNSTPKPMVPNPAADVDGVLLAGTTLITVGAAFNLKKLCLVDGQFGYDQYNLTDLISEGGSVKTVRISVSDGTTTEFYDVATASMRKSTYVRAPQGEDSGDVTVAMEVPFTLSPTSVDITGKTTVLGQLGQSTAPAVYVTKDMVLSSKLNLKYGDGSSSASNGVNQVVPTVPGTVVPDALVTAAKALTIQIVAFDPGQYYDESNFRKSNMALWVNYGQNKVAMPRPINFFTDYALGQENDQNVVEATSGVMNLGNSFRTVSIASGAMSDVASAMQYVQSTGVDPSMTALADLSLTHTMVRPIVFTTELDFTQETVNVMDESTRIKQVSGRLMNRLIPMIADMIAQSLIGLTYNDGEPIVLKVLAHSYLADVLFGLYDYFPNTPAQAEKETLPAGTTFSIPLPNGIRLDVVKVVWKTMEGKIAMFPAKDGDSSDLTNFGVIYSRGIASFMFNPTFDGATFRRCVSCQRELFVPTTIVGLAVRVIGLAAQLGGYGSDPIDLTTISAADQAGIDSNRTLPAGS